MALFRLILIVAYILSIQTLFSQNKLDNIVITDYTNTYELVATNSDEKVSQIKQVITYTYVATQAPGVAYAIAPYDADTKVIKAKAKGAKPIYEASIDDYLLYNDSHLCILPVELNKVGEEVTATFEMVHKKPEQEPNVYLGANYPIKNAQISFIIPSRFKGQYKIAVDNMPENYVIDESDMKDKYVISLSAVDLSTLKLPKDAPSVRRCHPSVQLLGWFKNIDDLYQYLHTLASVNDENIKDVRSLTEEIISTKTSDLEKIQAIYDWVHSNVRYIAIEHGDFGFIPDKASEVLRKRYADCKGSANLLKEMLKAAGFDGRLVWIGTRNIPYDWTERPALSTGNHMISAAILPNDSILYLDGTVGYADCGYYSYGIQGKQTIIENGENYMIHRVPFQTPDMHIDSITLNLSAKGDNLSGRYYRVMTGNNKTAFLNGLVYNNLNKKNLLTRTITRDRNNWTVDSISIANEATGNGPIEISANINISNAIIHAGDKSYLTLNPFPEINSYTFNLKDRLKDGQWNAPVSIIRNVFISTPYNVTLPTDIEINNNYFYTSIKYTKFNEGIAVKLTFIPQKSIIKYKDLKPFNEDIKSIAKAMSLKLQIL